MTMLKTSKLSVSGSLQDVLRVAMTKGVKRPKAKRKIVKKRKR